MSGKTYKIVFIYILINTLYNCGIMRNTFYYSRFKYINDVDTFLLYRYYPPNCGCGVITCGGLAYGVFMSDLRQKGILFTKPNWIIISCVFPDSNIRCGDTIVVRRLDNCHSYNIKVGFYFSEDLSRCKREIREIKKIKKYKCFELIK